MFIGLAAVYVSEFFAILGVSLAGQAPGFAHLGTAGWLVALTSGGEAELRGGLPPHGLGAATPGCRPGPKCPVLDSSDTKR